MRCCDGGSLMFDMKFFHNRIRVLQIKIFLNFRLETGVAREEWFTNQITQFRRSVFITINTLKPRRNEHFADDIFKRIFFNQNVWISIKMSLKFVPKGPINNSPALVQIMAWRRLGDKPLSEPMMVSLPTHICVTRPQWVNYPQI